jgi:DNA-binding transcriptional LysR family regulator
LTGIEDVVTVTSGSSAVVRGRLRVNVDAFFSRLMFAPHVSEFLSLHPDLSLDLIAKDQLGDLVGDGFDVAVRFGAPPDSSLMAKKLLETRTVTVASPAYLEARGRPAAPSDLVNHSCIQVRDSLTGQPIQEWQFRQQGKVVQVRIAGRLMVAEFGTMLGACLGGFGIARVKAIGVRNLIQQGSLVEVLSGWLGESFPLYALYSSGHLPAAKVRAFIDFVQSRVARADGMADEAPRAARFALATPTM